MRGSRRGVAGLAVGVLLAGGAAAAARGVDGVRTNAAFAWKTFELAGSPPQAPGFRCPQDGRDCTNTAGEPQIRASRTGAFFAASENGLGAGTLAWRSPDTEAGNGRFFQSLTSPNIVSEGGEDLAPGGGDVDLAVAPKRNASGTYNLYVSSLNLASVNVSTSADNGRTWVQNPAAADFPGGDDREWIAADGASKVCLSYHNAAQDIRLDCSNNAGATFLPS